MRIENVQEYAESWGNAFVMPPECGILNGRVLGEGRSGDLDGSSGGCRTSRSSLGRRKPAVQWHGCENRGRVPSRPLSVLRGRGVQRRRQSVKAVLR